MNAAERLAQVTAERDRYREEANKLRAVCHHMLEASRAMNQAAALQGQAQAQMREALAAMLGYDPDRVP